MPVLSQSFLGNDLQTWLVALGMAAVVYFALRLVQRVLLSPAQRVAVESPAEPVR